MGDIRVIRGLPHRSFGEDGFARFNAVKARGAHGALRASTIQPFNVAKPFFLKRSRFFSFVKA